MAPTTNLAASEVLISPEELDAEVLAEVSAAPGTILGTDVARRTRHGIVDVLVALARLTNAGTIERMAPGRYRCVAASRPLA